MPGVPVALASESMRAEKRKAAGNSLLAALAITGLKVFVGITTGSLGILSEAAHSALDLVAAIITLFSVRVSDKPADADHQYGHGKIENFSAFLETGLLLLTCIWIVWEAVRRMFFSHRSIEPSPAAFVVLFVSMAVDWWRSRALKKMASKYDSQALEADALHFGTDIWSSGVVAFGLALVVAGRHWHIPWLADADPVAAIFVAGVIMYVSSRLARQTIDALLDAAPPGARVRIMYELEGVDGVVDVERARIRRAGNRYFADLTLGLHRNVTFQRSEQVSLEATNAVRRVLPNADVVIHSVPREIGTENIFDRIRAVATRNNLNVHDVSVQDINGQLHVEQHLELDETLSLKAAHDVVTAIEQQIKSDFPEISSILAHIESEPATIETGDELTAGEKILPRLKAIAAAFPDVLDVHEVVVRKFNDRLYLSCHCTMADDLPLQKVHELSTALEIRFKQGIPELFKVLIHPEPKTDNRR